MLNTTPFIQLILVTVIAGVLTTSCSKSPDVRLTMCQDLTYLLLDSPEGLQWQEHKPIIKGYQDLEMQIQFAVTDSNGQISNAQASCFYKYNQVEPDAETFNTPTTDFSTYPHRMVLKNKEVDNQLLAKSVNDVMIQQGHKAVYKVKENVAKAKEKATEVGLIAAEAGQKVAEKVKEEVNKASEKIAKKLNE